MAGWYKEQIGPLPAGAWVAVVAGGLGITMWSRRHPAPATNTQVAPSADLGPTALPDNSLLGGASGGSGSTAPPPIVTNEDWARIASATLITHGYDPLLVTRAIADYLSGTALDDKETAAIQLALTLVGPPPLAPPNPGSVSTTPPPPTAPPPPSSILDIISGEETTPSGATLFSHNLNTYLPEAQGAGLIPVSTIPIYAVPAWPPRVVGYVPYGQELKPTGPAVMGPWQAGAHEANPGATFQNTFYPIPGGYVSGGDVVSKVAA